MSQQLQAGCCCGKVIEPPEPCEFCEPPFFATPSGASEGFWYTRITGGWSFSFSTTYRRFDGSTFIYQDFDLTVEFPNDVFEYRFDDPCNIEPIARVVDFSGDGFETPSFVGFNISLLNFGGEFCTHVVELRLDSPPVFLFVNGQQWDLYGPSQVFYRWAAIAENACNSRPNQGEYQVLEVQISGFGSGSNGFCVPVEQGCGGPIVGQACASATPITLQVLECG